jgi:hypothetical protein
MIFSCDIIKHTLTVPDGKASMSYTKYILLSGKTSKPYPTLMNKGFGHGTIGHALFDRRT